MQFPQKEVHNKQYLFALIIAGTILGLAGTDLVLPAVPTLPEYIKGTLSQAQLVLAAFTGGTAIGLLVFGELGARYDKKSLLLGTLAAYSITSFLCSFSGTILELVGYRVVQGFFAAAPAVFAPGIIRLLFDDRSALRALGLMGSIESVVPALAPVAGTLLLHYTDWRASFFITAGLAFLLSIIWLFTAALPTGSAVQQDKVSRSSYLALLRSGPFLRYALSQAFTLGGLLIFVFGAPTVITIGMNGSLGDFVIMQVIGITLFIIASNTVHSLVERFGPEWTIWFGSGLAATGSVAILIYALVTPNREPAMLWILFAFVNLGLGVRGPPGFYQAIIASGDNDARGAALVILLVFATTSIGTALLAPFITLGLLPLAATAAAVSVSALVVLFFFPPMIATKDL
ncbi:MAG: MFS transporter [Gammaproteobacteria bacterium]|jgi:MFS family permease|nr:MFS transporter [Gammaproteobacteria bacterium]MBT3870590.1 MFS transporter [Gammaproteobacteria bacterium]MBT4378203.1 MFS transporter [Gammaproteobacteria bacterium]MBT4618741.1 MFS transporter [Gammaproteobacteria bacterium]MBT5197084.1 MFS transporter [Gammaproteobacteria bacterium]